MTTEPNFKYRKFFIDRPGTNLHYLPKVPQTIAEARKFAEREYGEVLVTPVEESCVDKIEVAVVNGVEGLSLYVGEKRVAGPKPWGGGKTLKTWLVPKTDLLEVIGQTPSNDLINYIDRLMKIFDSVEESDSGREFHPTTISSCRTQHLIELQEILPKIREILSQCDTEEQ